MITRHGIRRIRTHCVHQSVQLALARHQLSIAALLTDAAVLEHHHVIERARQHILQLMRD